MEKGLLWAIGEEGLSLLPAVFLAGDVEGLHPPQNVRRTLEGLQWFSTLYLNLLKLFLPQRTFGVGGGWNESILQPSERFPMYESYVCVYWLSIVFASHLIIFFSCSNSHLENGMRVLMDAGYKFILRFVYIEGIESCIFLFLMSQAKHQTCALRLYIRLSLGVFILKGWDIVKK